jgi:hypothetical protein
LEAETDFASGAPSYSAANEVPACVALLAQIEIVKKLYSSTINTGLTKGKSQPCVILAFL